MYKNQLQELAQRTCFNLPSYTCIREGPVFSAPVCKEELPRTHPVVKPEDPWISRSTQRSHHLLGLLQATCDAGNIQTEKQALLEFQDNPTLLIIKNLLHNHGVAKKPAKRPTRQWVAWTREEEECLFTALRQVGK